MSTMDIKIMKQYYTSIVELLNSIFSLPYYYIGIHNSHIIFFYVQLIDTNYTFLIIYTQYNMINCLTLS